MKRRAWVGFVPVVASRELGTIPVRVSFDDTALVLFRDRGGRAAALLDRCPHRLAPLSAGRVREDGRLACPYHGWSFDGEGRGRSPSEPERTDCDTIAFVAREEHGVVHVAPPGDHESEPTRAPPEAVWNVRPAERRFLTSQRAGEMQLARMSPALPGLTRYRPYRVARVEPETDAITSFTFVPVDPNAHDVPPFRAGQHVSLRLERDGRMLVRSYSLSDTPNGESLRISVKRAGLVSTHVHALAVGDQVMLGDPAGDFVLPKGDHPLVLVAGGVGITPLFAMRKAAKRPVTLLYGVRHERELFRRAELEGAHLFVGRRIDEAALRSALETSPEAHLLLCGPGAMIDDLTGAAVRCGVPRERIHYERFRATLGPEVAALPECDVTFARTQRTVRWSPNEGSLLELADRHGIDLEHGCRVGSCGTCRVPVTRGETMESGTSRTREPGCLVCVSVPRGDVVLDA